MPTATGYYTHHDIPGICTFGDTPVPGLHPYDSTTLTSGQLRTRLQEQHPRWCVHFGSTRTVMDHDEATAWASDDDDQLLYVELMHPVNPDAPQRPSDLWLLTVDAQSGELRCDDEPNDRVWDTENLGNTWGNESHPLWAEAKDVAREIADRRSADRDLSDHRALETALHTVTSGVTQLLQDGWQDGETPKERRDFAIARGTEILDRAYNRARILQAGVKPGEMESLESYQVFHRMGWMPPTHEEMADHIIAVHGRRLRHRIGRVIDRLTGGRPGPDETGYAG